MSEKPETTAPDKAAERAAKRIGGITIAGTADDIKRLVADLISSEYRELVEEVAQIVEETKDRGGRSVRLPIVADIHERLRSALQKVKGE